MPRLAVGLEYDGTAYAGWQAQRDRETVQAAVEAAASRVADEPVRLHGSGRTDTGVHAIAQVAHFDVTATRGARQWLLGINSNLPDDVVARWVLPVDETFDARRSAIWREYLYVILNRPVRSALDRHRVWWVREPLDTAAMSTVAGSWLGERDFSAFRAAHCQSRSPMRHLIDVGVERTGDHVVCRFRANAFLYHMVRNMVGTLVAVGSGRMATADGVGLLAGRDRRRAGPTAPAAGLVLAGIAYDARFGLPVPPDVSRMTISSLPAREAVDS